MLELGIVLGFDFDQQEGKTFKIKDYDYRTFEQGLYKVLLLREPKRTIKAFPISTSVYAYGRNLAYSYPYIAIGSLVLVYMWPESDLGIIIGSPQIIKEGELLRNMTTLYKSILGNNIVVTEPSYFHNQYTSGLVVGHPDALCNIGTLFGAKTNEFIDINVSFDDLIKNNIHLLTGLSKHLNVDEKALFAQTRLNAETNNEQPFQFKIPNISFPIGSSFLLHRSRPLLLDLLNQDDKNYNQISSGRESYMNHILAHSKVHTYNLNNLIINQYNNTGLFNARIVEYKTEDGRIVNAGRLKVDESIAYSKKFYYQPLISINNDTIVIREKIETLPFEKPYLHRRVSKTFNFEKRLFVKQENFANYYQLTTGLDATKRSIVHSIVTQQTSDTQSIIGLQVETKNIGNNSIIRSTIEIQNNRILLVVEQGADQSIIEMTPTKITIHAKQIEILGQDISILSSGPIKGYILRSVQAEQRASGQFVYSYQRHNVRVSSYIQNGNNTQNILSPTYSNSGTNSKLKIITETKLKTMLLNITDQTIRELSNLFESIKREVKRLNPNNADNLLSKICNLFSILSMISAAITQLLIDLASASLPLLIRQLSSIVNTVLRVIDNVISSIANIIQRSPMFHSLKQISNVLASFLAAILQSINTLLNDISSLLSNTGFSVNNILDVTLPLLALAGCIASYITTIRDKNPAISIDPIDDIINDSNPNTLTDYKVKIKGKRLQLDSQTYTINGSHVNIDREQMISLINNETVNSLNLYDGLITLLEGGMLQIINGSYLNLNEYNITSGIIKFGSGRIGNITINHGYANVKSGNIVIDSNNREITINLLLQGQFVTSDDDVIEFTMETETTTNTSDVLTDFVNPELLTFNEKALQELARMVENIAPFDNESYNQIMNKFNKNISILTNELNNVLKDIQKTISQTC
jgi:hypothetical protein